jgi:hypothetical protein
MELLKKVFKKIFKISEIKVIESPKIINDLQYTKNDFMIDLKQQSNLEYDNRNGYKIIPNLKLKDMV